jgi:hypothetical protein
MARSSWPVSCGRTSSVISAPLHAEDFPGDEAGRTAVGPPRRDGQRLPGGGRAVGRDVEVHPAALDRLAADGPDRLGEVGEGEEAVGQGLLGEAAGVPDRGVQGPRGPGSVQAEPDQFVPLPSARQARRQVAVQVSGRRLAAGPGEVHQDPLLPPLGLEAEGPEVGDRTPLRGEHEGVDPLPRSGALQVVGHQAAEVLEGGLPPDLQQRPVGVLHRRGRLPQPAVLLRGVAEVQRALAAVVLPGAAAGLLLAAPERLPAQ